MQLPDHPAIGLRLTPRFDTDGPHSLDVCLRVQEPTATAAQPMFLYTTFQGNVPSHPYVEADVRARDDLGALPLRFVDVPTADGNTQQHWHVQRPTCGDVVLEFTAAARQVDRKTPVGARIDLRRDQGGLQGAGQWFLPQLISDKTHTNIVQWDLPSDAPEGTRCIWSYGEGAKPIVRVGLSTTIWNSIYMVGPVQSYPEVSPVGGESLAACCWFGSLPGNLDRVKKYNAELFPPMAAHFEVSGETYRVFIRKAEIGFGGTGFLSSYVLEYDETVEAETDDELKELFTHEMVHSFSTMNPEEDDYDNGWFTEGIAEFYASVLPYRFGLCGKDYLVMSINGHLQTYFTNPRIEMSIRDAAREFFSSWYAVWVPSKRGATYLILVDFLLRRKTGEHNIMQNGPLDRIVIDMAHRTRRGEEVRSQYWLTALRNILDDSDLAVEAHYCGMLAGQVLDLSGAFVGGLSYGLKPTELPILEFGFEKSSIRKGIVGGVIEGSAAARAGLRDGAEIIRTSNHNRATTTLGRVYELVVRMDGEIKTIRYLPRREETAPSWLLEC